MPEIVAEMCQEVKSSEWRQYGVFGDLMGTFGQPSVSKVPMVGTVVTIPFS